MAVQTHPTSTLATLPQRPQLRVVEARRRAAQLHLFIYVVGNALFWTLWAAISVTADRWYWWPILPSSAGRSCWPRISGMSIDPAQPRLR